ncbi:MAG: D-alanyl-D-alanine carboxypeptidase [Armatimonadetes bacterium]|nr:D-alanyl-D-alanine carboxypeptidase [Armatimonadota bacterium]MDE2205414.1 D-alanyl-D-alanine carboxypeptidase [Armatimonadota bacterium]
MASPALALRQTRLPVVPVIQATSAILVDGDTGQVLYAHNADDRLPMASTTKIMTAMLFCERVPPEQLITVSKYAASVGESSLHLKTGERLTAHDLLYAMILRSANDGCVAAAEATSGSEAAFVQLMNKRARALGLTNTHYANCHGLTAPGHFTSARDLATLARVALTDPRLAAVFRTRLIDIQRSIDVKDEAIRTHDHFLADYPGADGVKTGWTVPAGHCFVGSAVRDGLHLISVVLHSPNYLNETTELMNYGFGAFTPKIAERAGTMVGRCHVSGGTVSHVSVETLADLHYDVLRGTTPRVRVQSSIHALQAPVAMHGIAGEDTVLLDGQPVCSTPLVVERPVPHAAARQNTAAFGGFWICSILLLLLLVSLRNAPVKRRTRTSSQASRARRSGVTTGQRTADRQRAGSGKR